MLRDRLFESVIVLSGRLVDKDVGFGDLGVSSNLPRATIAWACVIPFLRHVGRLIRVRVFHRNDAYISETME